MINKGLYIGNDIDLNIVKKFDFIDTFVLVDNQNLDEYTKYAYYYQQNHILSEFCPCLFRKINNPHDIILKFKKYAKDFDFILIGESYKKLIFKHKNQTIIYYFNTSIPEDTAVIQEDIIDFNHLFIIGFDPHHQILNYTKNKITLWANLNTIFKSHYDSKLLNNEDNDYSDYNNIIYCLNYDNFYIKEKFNKFNLVDNKETYYFNNWFNLINFSSNLR